MMTKTTSKTRVWRCNYALMPALIAAICLFSTKTIAQCDTMALPVPPIECVDVSPQDNNPTATPVLSQDDKLDELLRDNVFAARHKEYNELFDRCVKINGDTLLIDYAFLSQAKKDRLIELFLSMSSEQQDVQNFTFQRRRATRIMEEITPTVEQFESWKKSMEYKVFIDNKRVEKLVLNQHQPSDFKSFVVIDLPTIDEDYGKYKYQLSLLTTVGYIQQKKMVEEIAKDENLYPNYTGYDGKKYSIINITYYYRLK